MCQMQYYINHSRSCYTQGYMDIDWTKIDKVLIVQPENPDGDSVASALALEEILGDLGKQVHLYSYVHIPEYLGYISGFDRISDLFPGKFDLTIVVDTVTASLLENTLSGGRLSAINGEGRQALILDHHPTENDLPLTNAVFYGGEGDCVSTGEIVYHLAIKNKWKVNQAAATHIVESMLADTLGLNTEAVGPQAFRVVADMLDAGANMADIDKRRREFMKKPPEVITYKGTLLQRVEYLCDGKLAMVHIPWDEIQRISPHYNPSVLALEELRNAEGVELIVALKSYPDGKITGKLRANSLPIAGDLAAHFGGGGHAYAAGFKVHDWTISDIRTEIIKHATNLVSKLKIN